MKSYKHKKTGDIVKYYAITNTYMIQDNTGTIFKPQFVENSNDWEEIVDRDYEILSFINNDTKSIAELHNNGKYCYKGSYNYRGVGILDLDNCLNDKSLNIYQVKRLSDGQVFTVGDKINYEGNDIPWGDDDRYCKIQEFSLHNNYIYINQHWVGGFDRKISDWILYKDSLFTTQDGVEIYEDDEYFVIMKPSNNIRSSKEIKFLLIDDVIKRTYSTREKAEEYIYWNDPVLTLNDVATIYKGLTYLRDNTPQKPGQKALDLLELVKSKYE